MQVVLQLFARARHGHYLPNPAMLLRMGPGWVHVYDALGLAWLEAGCGSEEPYQRTPAEVVARLGAGPADAKSGPEQVAGG